MVSIMKEIQGLDRLEELGQLSPSNCAKRQGLKLTLQKKMTR